MAPIRPPVKPRPTPSQFQAGYVIELVDGKGLF